MTTALALDMLLWLLVGLLTVAVLALARQVGVLNQRVAPAGALTPTRGPKMGELTEAVDAEDLAGRRVSIGGPDHAANTLGPVHLPDLSGVQIAVAGGEIPRGGGRSATGVRQ